MKVDIIKRRKKKFIVKVTISHANLYFIIYYMRKFYWIRFKEHSHDASVPIGSQAGNTTGSCLKTSITCSGTRLLSTTTSNTYSSNHSLVINKYPLSPLSSPQEFSTRHLVGLSFS